MSFSPSLALRYLKPKRTFVSIITIISILGVTVSVWLFTVVIAVFTGYGEKIRTSILGFEPHLVVDSGGIIRDYYEVLEKAAEVPAVRSATPYVSGPVVMDFQGMRSTPMIRGILPPEGEELEHMRSKIAEIDDPEKPGGKRRQGDFDLNDFYSAVIGDGMAEAQNIKIGDKLLFYSPRDIDSIMKSIEQVEKGASEEEREQGLASLREMTAPQEVVVTGIFDSGHGDFDAHIVFVHLETAQVLYNFDLEQCHGVAIRTDDGLKVNHYKRDMEAVLPQHFRVLTWIDMHRAIFDAVAAERQAMYLILFIIMIVGGCCIMNTMITITSQKRTDVGLLKALGAREPQIATIFLIQGSIVGLIGIVAGLLIAQVTLEYRNDLSGWIGGAFGVDLFSEEAYKIDGGLPAKQTWKDLTIISGSAFLACTIASIIPAILASLLQPAKALRGE